MPRSDIYDEQYNRGGLPPPPRLPNVPSGRNKPPYREEGEGPLSPPPPINPPGPTNEPPGPSSADPQGTGGYYQQYGQQDVIGTDLQSVLGGKYDVGALQKEYGDIFADYDPTREQFAQKGLEFGQEAAGLGYQRQLGQYERQAELLGSQLGEEGYLAQAMGRQMGQLGLQEAGAQRGISETYTGGRQGLMAMREQAGQAAGRGGFAGSGAAQTQSERSRQAYMGQLSGGVSNLRDRISGIGIQREGVQAGFAESTERAQSQLSGIQAEIGEGGFLNKAYQNQLGQLGLGFQEDVYGLRDKYGEKQRDRLLDLISSGADLSRFRSGATGGTPTPPGGNIVDRTISTDPSTQDPSGDYGGYTGNDDYEDYAEGGTGPAYDAWLAQQQQQGNTTQYGNQNQEGYNPNIQPQKDVADMYTGGARGDRG